MVLILLLIAVAPLGVVSGGQRQGNTIHRSRKDAGGLGERARLARTGRRPPTQPGQFPARLALTHEPHEALGGTPRAATETVALPFSTTYSG